VTPPPPELHNPLAGGSDNCPSCGATLAPDQRYCLHCGQRRGDPRLPFMDAVVFMDAAKRPRQPATAATAPPSTPDRRPLLSANASLVAGVATLVLAIGVGVLIGRTGDSGSSNAANASPQVIRVEGGGGGTGEAPATTGGSSGGAKAKGSAKSKGKAKKKLETGSSGTTKAAEEVLKPAGDVKLPPPTTQVGDECEKGTAGCSDSGEFNGSFFGE
jgi:hypothetical protein